MTNKSQFMCKSAVMRKPANSLAKEALRMEYSEVSMEKVNFQHKQLQNALEGLGLKVHMIDSDESLPDCVFVEDPVVVVGNKALLTTTGHISRRKEKEAMKAQLEMIEGMQVAEMSELNEEATLDGGDVMCFEKEIFVGLSTRTNRAGLEVMRGCFPDHEVHGVAVGGELHLKSCVTIAGRDTILASVETQATRDILKNLKQAATEKYNYVELDSQSTKANVIYLETEQGSVIIHKPMKTSSEIEALDKLKADKKIEVDTDELAKVDGCLTCCCVLISI